MPLMDTPQPPSPYHHLAKFGRRSLQCTALAVMLSWGLVWLPPRWGMHILYTLWITLGCAFAVNGLRLLVANVRWRCLRRTDMALHADGTLPHWPGWAWMAACIVMGTAMGVLGGMGLAEHMAQWEGLPSMAGSVQAGSPGSHGELPDWLQNLVLSLFVSLLATAFFYARERVAISQRLAEQAQRLAAENQLRLLQAQLEPHMLFNTLANLRALMTPDPLRAQAMLDHLIAFLRTTLMASRQPTQPLSDEFAHLADYLALMQVRMGRRLQTELVLPEALRDYAVPPLLLQPLVENAIRHGLEPKIEGGTLRVQATHQGDKLCITVLDTGLGLSSTTTSTVGTRFGLAQVRERLAATWGDAATLTLSHRTAGGTEALLTLPFATPASLQAPAHLPAAP